MAAALAASLREAPHQQKPLDPPNELPQPEQAQAEAAEAVIMTTPANGKPVEGELRQLHAQGALTTVWHM